MNTLLRNADLSSLPNVLSNGFIYSDRSIVKDHPKNVKATAVYTPLTSAISYPWSSFTKRQTKEVNPALYFAVLGELFCQSTYLQLLNVPAIWKFRSLHNTLPEDISHADELETISNNLISEAAVDKQVLTSAPRQLIEYKTFFLVLLH